MTEPQPLDLTAFLATAEHAILQAPHGSDHEASEALISAGCYYAPRLLAAVEAVLAQHQPGRVLITGALCPRHENHRHFSITGTEAASVRDCPDCAASVWTSCAGCPPQMPLDSCPVRSAISAALMDEGETDG